MKSKLQAAYDAHQLTIQDKIHIALYSPSDLFPDLPAITTPPEYNSLDPDTVDKLALLGLSKLQGFDAYDAIQLDCNLQEVI